MPSFDIACDVSGTLFVSPISAATPSPAGDLVAIDPTTGEQRGVIELPPVSAMFPTPLPDIGLAIAGGELYRVDGSTLRAERIPLEGGAADLTPNEIQFRGTSGKRHILLGSPSFDRAVLVDLAANTALDLVSVISAKTLVPAAIPFAAVVPGDEHVLVWNGQHVFVVPIDDPAGVIQLDDAGFGFAPDFSPDGTEAVFSQSSGPGSGAQVVVVGIDGTGPRVLLDSTLAAVTLWAPESRTILVDKRTEVGSAAGQVTLLNADTGDERDLLDYSGSLTTVQFAPDGEKALLGVESMTASDWFIADLRAATTERIDALSGGRAMPGLYADSRWALVVPLTQEETPLSRPAFRSVDLENGVIGRVLEQRPRKIYLTQPVLSPDGRLALVVEQDDKMESLILLDGAELRATTLGDGITVAGVFGPNGCGVALSIVRPGESVVHLVLPGTDGPTVIDDASAAAWIA